MNLPSSATDFAQTLSDRFSKCCDFALRKTKLLCGKTIFVASFTVYCDKTYISEVILRPLSEVKDKKLIASALAVSKISRVKDTDEAVSSLVGGFVLVFFDSEEGGKNTVEIYRADAKSSLSRTISQPESEVVIRGPREGFVESAEMNVALLRKRLKTEKLCVEKISCGSVCPTDIFITYIDGICENETLELIRKKLSEIKLPCAIDSGYIEHFLSDSKYPLLPDVGNSEKPDKVAAKLIGGRVAIICDGSPCVLTLPYFFVESLQSAEDYLKSTYYATFLRVLRLVGAFTALFLPAIYIALVEFSPSAIPHTLYLTISRSRADIPFTAFTEICVVLFVFEIIREVGVRMPRAVGNAVSVVAGIILGDAAIKAGIASAPAIMVAALSATCNFIDPPIMNAMPLLRFLNLALARIFGLLGVALFSFCIIYSLISKTSAKKPYLFPFSPLKTNGMYDAVLVIPQKALKKSESEISEGR